MRYSGVQPHSVRWMAQATRPAGPLEGPRAQQTGPIQVTWAKSHALNGGSKGNLCCDFASTSKDLVWGLGVPSQTLWEMQRQDIQNAGKQPTQRSNRALGGFERAFLSPQSLRWSLTCANWRTFCLPKWPSQKDQKYLRSRSLAGLLSGFEPSERRHLPAPTCGSCTPRFPSSGREVTLPPCMIEPRPDFQTRDGHWMKPKANVDSGPTCLSDVQGSIPSATCNRTRGKQGRPAESPGLTCAAAVERSRSVDFKRKQKKANQPGKRNTHVCAPFCQNANQVGKERDRKGETRWPKNI